MFLHDAAVWELSGKLISYWFSDGSWSARLQWAWSDLDVSSYEGVADYSVGMHDYMYIKMDDDWRERSSLYMDGEVTIRCCAFLANQMPSRCVTRRPYSRCEIRANQNSEPPMSFRSHALPLSSPTPR